MKGILAFWLIFSREFVWLIKTTSDFEVSF